MWIQKKGNSAGWEPHKPVHKDRKARKCSSDNVDYFSYLVSPAWACRMDTAKQRVTKPRESTPNPQPSKTHQSMQKAPPAALTDALVDLFRLRAMTSSCVFFFLRQTVPARQCSHPFTDCRKKCFLSGKNKDIVMIFIKWKKSAFIVEASHDVLSQGEEFLIWD